MSRLLLPLCLALAACGGEPTPPEPPPAPPPSALATVRLVMANQAGGTYDAELFRVFEDGAISTQLAGRMAHGETLGTSILKGTAGEELRLRVVVWRPDYPGLRKQTFHAFPLERGETACTLTLLAVPDDLPGAALSCSR